MIKVKTILNKELVNALQKFTLKKTSISILILNIVMIILGIILICLKEYGAGVGFITFGVIYYPIYFIVMKLSQKSASKGNSLISEETIVTYEFDNDSIKVTTKKGEEFSSENTQKYSSLYKAYETNDAYFIYISKLQAHVFFKKDIVEGSIEELNTILKNNLGKKFKALKKQA